MIPQYEIEFIKLVDQNTLDSKKEDLVDYVIRVFDIS